MFHRRSRALVETGAVLLAPQVFIEEVDGPLPRQLGGGFVVARRGVVVEAVIGALVDIRGVGDVVGFQRLFISRPAAGDPLVERGVLSSSGALIFAASAAEGCAP